MANNSKKIRANAPANGIVNSLGFFITKTTTETINVSKNPNILKTIKLRGEKKGLRLIKNRISPQPK